MNGLQHDHKPARDHELRFCSLRKGIRDVAFPCDAEGRVDLDALSGRERIDYLYARAVVGHQFAVPAVAPGALH